MTLFEVCLFVTVPGPPSSVYFPEVTWTTVRIVWSPPLEPNGVIRFYRVSYRQSGEPPSNAIVDDQIPASVGEKYLLGLLQDRVYVFTVTASTSLGWGEPAEEKVRTVVNRRKCRQTSPSSCIGHIATSAVMHELFFTKCFADKIMRP